MILSHKQRTGTVLSHTFQAAQPTFGWKSAKENSLNSLDAFELFEHCKGINKTMDDCVEEDSLSLTDFLAGAKFENTYDPSLSIPIDYLTSASDWSEDMALTTTGKYFTFEFSKTFVFSDEYCLMINLFRNLNFTFFMFVHDEKFFVYNANTLGPPINYRTFQGNLLEKNHYQELTLTKHKKLNLARQPCEEDTAYNFKTCVQESLSKKVKPSS